MMLLYADTDDNCMMQCVLRYADTACYGSMWLGSAKSYRRPGLVDYAPTRIEYPVSLCTYAYLEIARSTDVVYAYA